MTAWLALRFASMIALPWGKWLRWLFVHPLVLTTALGAGAWWIADRSAHKWHVQYDHLAEQVDRATEQNKRAQSAQDANQADMQAERNRRTADVSKASETARVGAVAAYADSHRLRAGTGGVCTAPAATVHPDSTKPDEPTGATNLVAVSTADLNSLSEGAVQGAVRLRFLESLVASGQAVVVPDAP